MKISVIVTTYNSPGYLGRVLEGFRVQSRLPDELIVADDGSGPETASVVSQFKANASFEVRHVWHEDKGFRAAHIRNAAVRVATGDYIVFIDGDCIVNRHFISDHIRLAREGFFVQGKRVIASREVSKSLSLADINSTSKLMGLAMSGGISNWHHILRLSMLPTRQSMSHRGIKTCNMGVMRADVMAVNGFDERYVGWGREDSDFAARLYNYGLKRLTHPFMAICFHLWHAENDRAGLDENNRRLRETMESGEYRCADGIEKG